MITNFLQKIDRSFKPEKFLTLDDYEHHALKKLSPSVSHFFSGKSMDGLTFNNNLSQYEKLNLVPRVLKDVENISLATQYSNLSAPLIIAPMAFQKLANDKGEVATAKAASKHNILMSVSTCSTCSLEAIKKASVLAPWFQSYVYKNKNITKHLIEKATDSGYGGIILTVDAPYYAKRIQERQFPLSFPKNFDFSDLIEAGIPPEKIKDSGLPHFLTEQLDPSLNWKVINWIRSLTPLPIILKGILHPKDIEIACKEGVKTVILSNHGGRQLDTAITPLESLIKAPDKFKEDMDLIVDGGIRRGTDILKALALGARATMIGRPILWGLASQGEYGVYNVIQLLKEELSLSMALTGCSSIKNINPEILDLV